MSSTAKRRVLVLGAGRVGAAIVRDLVDEFAVTVADASADALAALADLEQPHGLRRLTADLADGAALAALLADADFVVGAVPGPMGFATLRQVVDAGRPVVDISFFEEDALALDALARARGAVAIVDCGVAPGMSNLLLGAEHARLAQVERFWCAVGGLPAARSWPYEYKAPFSPIDVIAEYNRPARLRRAGVEVTLPALSEVELIEVPSVGTLEAFNTDGLRTLLQTIPVPDMVEKTMRYPGHAERMRALRETGFFREDPIEAGGSRVRPLDVTAQLLMDAWRFAPGEADLTVMRVIIEGRSAAGRERVTYDLFDRYDPVTGIQSMARTTGYTATAALRFLAAGRYGTPGITPPERLGSIPGATDFFLADLERHGVLWTRRAEVV